MQPIWLDIETKFPNPELADASGLLAMGGKVNVTRLLSAYKNGIFPWPVPYYPVFWFSPDPRFVLYPDKYKTTKSLRQIINRKIFTVKFDTCFEEVIKNCATVERKGEQGTWITDEIIKGYIKFHKSGYAHSVEVFYDGELVGGLYGVSLSGVFVGESMFYKMSNASKVALYYLVEKVKSMNFDFIDAQVETPHFKEFGAENIPRSEYLKLLKKSRRKPTVKGKW